MDSKTPSVAARSDKEHPRWRSILLALIAFAAAFWLLRETFSVMMPVAFALLLALALWPIAQPIRDRMPSRLRWMGAAAALLVALIILAVFLIGLGIAARQVYELGSSLGPQLQEQFGNVSLPDIFSDGGDTGSQDDATPGGLTSTALTALNMTARTIGGIVLILFLMLLMLTEAGNWHQKILALVSRGGDRRWLEIGRSVGEKFRAYIVTRLILGVITAALYVGWLAVFGIDYLLLWGILAVLLNFVPTVGSIIAGALPVVYAVLTRDVATAAIVAGGLLVIEQVMGNFVDPKIMGRRLAISPLVVLISLLFWSILWGIPGAFLAVPMTVLVTMTMAHFERLKPAALLMTDCATLEELEEHSRPHGSADDGRAPHGSTGRG